MPTSFAPTIVPVVGSIRRDVKPAGTSYTLSGLPLSAISIYFIQIGSAARPPVSTLPNE